MLVCGGFMVPRRSQVAQAPKCCGPSNGTMMPNRILVSTIGCGACRPAGWGSANWNDVPTTRLLSVALWQQICLGLCPDGLVPLSDFTLAILDIATVDLTTITWKSAIATLMLKRSTTRLPTAGIPLSCPPAAGGCACSQHPEVIQGNPALDPFGSRLLPRFGGEASLFQSDVERLPAPSDPAAAVCVAPTCPCGGTTDRCFTPNRTPVPETPIPPAAGGAADPPKPVTFSTTIRIKKRFARMRRRDDLHTHNGAFTEGHAQVLLLCTYKNV